MSELLDFIKENPGVFISLLSALAATISATSAAITVSSSKRKLRCTIQKQAVPVHFLYAIDENKQTIPDPFEKPVTHLIELSLVNPSSLPVSYFDLEVTTPDGTFLPFPVNRWSEMNNYRAVGFSLHGSPSKRCTGRLMMPDDVNGTVTSNGYLPIMLAVDASGLKEVTVSFKICKRSLRKNRHHSKPERYKTYHYTVTIQ